MIHKKNENQNPLKRDFFSQILYLIFLQKKHTRLRLGLLGERGGGLNKLLISLRLKLMNFSWLY